MSGTTEIELDGQYRVLRDGAGVLERDARLLEVSGADAAEFLQGQLTNDVEGLSEGDGCYAALLDRKGHMQGDMRVLRHADHFSIDSAPEGADAIRRHLSTYKIGREVTLEDRSDELSVLSVIGPAATELALGGPLRPEHAHRKAELAGIPFVAVATDTGVDAIVGAADCERLRSAIAEAGAEPVSEDAAEILRVERGRPRFGREMTTATIPQEAGINERAVDFTKGCYIGQETVARLHYKGKPNRRLRGLRLDRPAAAGDAIRLGERELGTVGTAVVSPALGPIGLAIVRREAEPGASVEVGEGIGAEVVELPF